MLYFKAPGRYLVRDSPAAAWGKFTHFLEVGDDQYASRQVNFFENGHILRYDRSHWCDDYGMLSGLRFSRKPKWARAYPGAEEIPPAEFEKVWRAAGRSGMWKSQVDRSRAGQWGDIPHWLRNSETT